MRWLVSLFLLASSAVLAEPATTVNVLPNLSSFVTSGSTTSSTISFCREGEFCTGNASNGGGTYTSNFNVPLTEAEVRRGFTLNSSVTVDSHPSNAVVASCVSITQSGDCRDIFRLGIDLLDGETIAGSFLHEVELDFSGQRDFSFTNVIEENSFGTLSGTLFLFGTDAGFSSGFFGPKFSDPALTFTFDQLVEQQILDQIAQNDVVAAAPPPPEIIVADVSVDLPPPSAPPPPPVVEFAPPPPEAPPPPPEIQVELPPPPAAEAQVEAQAEAAIEAEIEAQPEPAEVQSEPEPEAPAPAEAQPESSPEPAEAQPEPETATAEAPTARPPQSQPKAKTRQEKVKAAAEKIVAKIAPSQRYSAAAQTTTLVAMGLIAPRLVTAATLTDTPGFFTATNVPDGASLVNPLQNYVVFGRANGAHEAFVQLQWNK
jgi:hypothetical protein